MTRMPSASACSMNATKSPSDPCLSLDAVEIGDVVAVVAVRGWVERLEPHAGHAEALQVIEAPHQALEVADAVAVGVLILLDIETVDREVGDGPSRLDGDIDVLVRLSSPRRSESKLRNFPMHRQRGNGEADQAS